MHDVGGRATVDSAPGEGACITLRWRPLLDSVNRRLPARDAAQSEAASWERSLSASMESAGARAIAAGLVLVHFILVVYECAAHSYWHWPPVALSFIALLFPAILLLKTWPDSLLPSWVAQLTVIVIAAVNFLVLPQIITTGWPGYASWCTGAGNDLSCGLLMRGRSGHRRRRGPSDGGLSRNEVQAWARSVGKVNASRRRDEHLRNLPAVDHHPVLGQALHEPPLRRGRDSQVTTGDYRGVGDHELALRQTPDNERRAEDLRLDIGGGRGQTHG